MVMRVLWWTMRTASVVLSAFFLFLGIDLCRASFNLNNPHQFILTFFASNLIILISIVILIGVIAQMIVRLRHGRPSLKVTQPQLAPDSSQPTDRRDL